MGCQSQDTEKPRVGKVQIGEQVFTVDVADTIQMHAKGLQYIAQLAKNTGMLFVFEENDYHRFWMKNTFLSLDVIWISEDWKVQHIKTLEPCTTDPCRTYGPFEQSKYVLEVNAGEFVGSVGEEVEFRID